jgi:hypothetical protein
MVVATAALVQPGDEGRPYDRRTAYWQRFGRKLELFGGLQRLMKERPLPLQPWISR